MTALPRAQHSQLPYGGFAHVHRPAGAPRGALVILPPFGYEAVCAQRSLRHLAEAAARAGLVGVRLELPGTGDDLFGSDLDSGIVDRWLGEIPRACEALELQRVVVCGVRLGALLATIAAARDNDGRPERRIVGVAAIAPVTSGRAFVREGRALQAALDLAPAPPGLAPPDDIHEVVGFAQTAAMRAKLGELDLVKTSLPAADVLVIDRDDLPSSDKWLAKLGELGARVEHHRLPGYVEMVLDPHKAVVPTRIIETTVAFAARVIGADSPALVSGDRYTISSGHDQVKEQAVEINHYLRGIVSFPRRVPSSGRGLVLLNAGAVGRIGPNRLYVELARKLAAHGDTVLRFDLSGIGDSETRPGAEENDVYGKHAIADIASALGWIRGHTPRDGTSIRTVAVVGLCSGAYHGLKAAIAGQPIDTVVAINPLTFDYKPGMPLDFAAFRVTADAQRYAQSARSTESWKKLLRGDVDVRRVAKIVLARVRNAAEHRGKDVLRRFRVPLRDDLGTDLLALARRGVAIRFIFSASDPGSAMLAEQGGSAVTRLVASGALTIRVIDGPDHTFTPRWSHPILLDAIATAVT